MKKFLALMIAFIMVFSLLNVVAFAEPDGEGGSETATVNITIHQDSSYSGTAGQAGRNYRYYLVFTAVPSEDFAGNANEDGGYDPDTGAPLAPTGDTENGVAYIASKDVADQLGTWVPATPAQGTEGEDGYVAAVPAHWAPVDGNKWFTLTPIVGTETFSVAWTAVIPEGQENAGDPDTSSAAAQAAAAWLLENGVYEETGFGDLDWNPTDKVWEATVAPGYYIIQSYGDDIDDHSSGANLIAATTDIEILEKNAYPPIVKLQKDEDYEPDDDPDTDDEYTDDDVNVAIGDVIDYEVTVKIPVTAKVGDTIEVWDKPSEGLTYNDDVEVFVDGTKVTPAENTQVAEAGTLESGDIWRFVITVNKDNIGKEVVFTFSMTVNENALEDTGRENSSGLIYGNEYDSLPSIVKYTTYFAGIHKIDPTKANDDPDRNLEGVKFDLKENGVAFNVKAVTQTTGEGESAVTTVLYYIPDSDANGSNEVVTNADGMIIIRGLDLQKTYTLTETYTLPGYNMLDGDVTLSLYEDTTEIPGQPPQGTEGEDGYVPGTDAIPASYVTATTDTSDSDYMNLSTWGQVENKQGTILPSTGGIGTTLFYVIGGILVAGAFVLLVTKRRMAAKN